MIKLVKLDVAAAKRIWDGAPSYAYYQRSFCTPLLARTERLNIETKKQFEKIKTEVERK